MAPVAVQGYWSNIARKPFNGKFSRESMEKYLIDTCYTWRKDGPLTKQLEPKQRAQSSPKVPPINMAGGLAAE